MARPSALDERVVAPAAAGFIRACQARVPCHLGGGAALAGAYLHHRVSADADLFVHDREGHRLLVGALPGIGQELGLDIRVDRDAGTFLRAHVATAPVPIAVDIVHEALPDLEPPGPAIDGIVVESLADLRASKLTCILSRSEPRDLVDLLFLDRAGFPPEQDLALALRKDAGIDPGILAWLLGDLPCAPLPSMLVPLTVGELRQFRDDLRERFRRLAVRAQA
ncbi:MAG: nucleotidyl transferase AbiEii/AbiGii toxin family protein [Deltaproteobacteria bacterium]|nr:nucleotidyl transferase AbiEii/AbiGii toxin family protein [Deltaproteobacteria bacterium]